MRGSAMAGLLLLLACSAPAENRAKAPDSTRPAQTDSSYEAVRDAYAKALTAREERGDKTVDAADAAAIHDLQARLQPLIGEFNAPFVTARGRINLQTLLPGEGDSWLADGMLYTSRDKSTHVLVTTQPLLASWLARHPLFETVAARDPHEALSDPAVLTQIFDVDAAVSRYADVPVDTAVSRGVVSAVLVARAQDFCQCRPNEIFVSVIRGPRVFIIDAPARDTAEIPPPCIAVWDSGSARQKALVDSSFAATPHDTILLNRSFKEEAATNAAFRTCYGDHLVHEPRFASIMSQVRELVAGLPAR